MSHHYWSVLRRSANSEPILAPSLTTILLIVAYVTNPLSAATKEEPRARPANSLPPLCLVWADFEQITPATFTGGTGTFRITRVYAGPEALRGKTFSFNNVNLTTPRNGLWWLTLVPRKDRRHPRSQADLLDACRIEAIPYRRPPVGQTPPLAPPDEAQKEKEQRALDRAVANVQRAKAGAPRIALLKKLAETEPSPVADWAICQLGQDGKTHLDFLRKLADNEKLPVVSQVTLDRLLCRIDLKGWMSAEGRQRLLERWLDPTDKASFELGCQRLLEASREGEISITLYSKVLDPVLAKAPRLTEHQIWWLGRTLRELLVAPEERGEAFDWLLGQVRNARSFDLRKHAAMGLNSLTPLTAAQMDSIRALRKTLPAVDRQVGDVLDQVLAHSHYNHAVPRRSRKETRGSTDR